MTTEIVSRFQQWLKDKKVTKTCPACGAPDWAEPQQIVAFKRFKGILWDANNVHPSIETLCGNCGYTAYFRMDTMGLYSV